MDTAQMMLWLLPALPLAGAVSLLLLGKISDAWEAFWAANPEHA